MANTSIPEVTTATYRVPEQNLSELEAKLQKLVKKSAKLSAGGVSYGVDRENPVDVPMVRNGGKPRQTVAGEEPTFFRRYFQVTVTGTVPRLAGWTFIATLDHMDVDGETANILRVVPGMDESLPVEFRTASPENCDHCHKKIRTRKNTFVVRGEDGSWKQIGRNCTQDFLGGLNPQDVAKSLEFLQLAFGAAGEDFEGGLGWTDKGSGFGFETFLTTVAGVIRAFGWLSRGKARAEDRLMQATANVALELLTPPRGNGPELADWEALVAKVGYEDSDRETAVAAIEYVRENIDFQNETNDFRYNLRVAFGQDVVYTKLAGIVAAGVMFYQKEQQKLKEAAGLRKPTSTEFIGALGDKVKFEDVQMVFKKRLEGNWGGYDLAKFVTADGKSITVFGQVDGAVGDLGSLEGKVVKHETYQDKPSTQIKGRTLFTTAARLAELAELKAAKKAEKAAAAKARREAKKAEKAAVQP